MERKSRLPESVAEALTKLKDAEKKKGIPKERLE